MSAQVIDFCERARLTGKHVRVIMAVPRCTCVAKAMPTIHGDTWRCPCGWLSGDGLEGWAIRVRDELEYLDGQE